MGTVISAALATSAWAGPALDDGSPPAGTTADGMPVVATEENPVEYGIGIRLRNVRVPKSVLELFVERSAGGASNVGFGVELLRRRGTVELQLGFEFERLEVGEGVWINKGENVASGDEADYILAPKNTPDGSALGWFTIEFTFINHAVINKYLSFRYGGGAGLGIITGDLYRYNIICNGATNNSPEPGCLPPPPATSDGRGMYSEGTQTAVKYDLPPVFPVINGIIGVQLKPMDKLVINLETGIRTVPFLGTSVAYFF